MLLMKTLPAQDVQPTTTLERIITIVRHSREHSQENVYCPDPTVGHGLRSEATCLASGVSIGMGLFIPPFLPSFERCG
eukprot:404727-Amphidinium_carterae.1